MYTAETFCNSIWGMSYSRIQKQIDKNKYRKFVIPKKGGKREINYLERDSMLWVLQNKLLAKFFERQPVPVCVKGFIKGESYNSFLSEHIGGVYFLRIDIASFFPSVYTAWIKDVFSGMLQCNTQEDKDKLIDLICEIVTLDDALPQGACTSPAVSNLVMARLDQRITKYCQVYNIRYTRYADDLLFSSQDFDFKVKKWFLKKIKYILHSRKLKLNYSKLKYGNKEMVLNGYVISRDGIRLSRNRLSDIRRVISFTSSNRTLLKLNGPKVFLSHANGLSLKHRNLTLYPFKNVFQFCQYMCGYRSYLISMIDNNSNTVPFQKELQKLIRKTEEQIEALL